MYYVYVLWSNRQKEFYIGYTGNLERRLKEHESGQCHTTARMDSPKLIFYEAFTLGQEAERRESYFKTSKGKKVLRLMLQESMK